MTHPVTRAAGRSLGSTLLTLVLIPVVVAVVFGLPALVTYLLPLEGVARLATFFGGVLVLLFGFVAGALAFAMLRTGVLDAGFGALGMRGSSTIPNIRHYRGQRGGRELFGTYARRGGLLELAVELATGAQAAFTMQSTVGTVRELVGLSPLQASGDPALAGIVSHGADPGWTHALLSSPGVPQALRALLEDPSGREIRWVHVRPGCVKITRRWIDPDAAGATLLAQADALEVLASACARLGAPGRPIAEGALERRARHSPMSLAFGIVGCLLLAILVPTMVVTGLVFFSVASSSPTVAPAPGPAPTMDEGQPDPGGGRRRRRR